MTTNRTHWPIDGGAVAFQPGWNAGHKTALMYINIGLGEEPGNYSWPITTFGLEGPSNTPYPGTVCLPQLTLPDEVRSRVKSGDLATIQLVEAAKHGAGLFTVSGPRTQASHVIENLRRQCADIIFTDDQNQVPDVNESNCFNSTSIRVSGVPSLLNDTQYPAANNCAHLMQGNNGALAVLAVSLVSTFMFLLGRM